MAAAQLAAVAVTTLATPEALAQNGITLELTARMGGNFQPGGWAAVDLSIANAGTPIDAYATAESETGTVRRFVELPAGARKTVQLYVRPEPFARRLTVRLLGVDGGTLGEAQVEIRTLDTTGSNIAVVGDESGNLRTQLFAADDRGGAARVIPISPIDLPERPEPLNGFRSIIWAADGGELTEAQGRSLERWVASGRDLVVVGGADWQARVAGLEELLPLTALRAVEASPAALGVWAGSALPTDDADETLSVGDLREGASVLVPMEAGSEDASGGALISATSLGAGRVTFIGADMASDAYRDWSGAPSLWSRLIPDTRILEQFFGMPVDQQSFAFIGALGSIAALGVPPAELLLLVILGYILLIGPVNYLVLRRLDRRELAWVTAPLLVVLFSATSYGIGNATKGGDIILNEIAVVRAARGGSAASVESYAGVFSPNRASYDLTVREDALIAALGTGNQFDPQTGQPIIPTAEVEQGDPAHLRGLEVNVFGLQAVRADAVVAYSPSLDVDWHFDEGGIAGSVQNTGDVRVEDVAVVNGNAELLGDLDPGASADFSLGAALAFSGEPVSQQIYGFDDFSDPSPTEERLRRQVVDGLTGGGFDFFGMGGPAPFIGGSGGGPFIIGWREGGNPVAFEVDGRVVERHTQTVEVLSGRPEYRPGPIELRAGQLSSTVVAIEGDATRDIPGGVTIGSGSAEIRIALPLEVAELEPTEIDIIGGGDPGMVFAPEQFGGGGFFPPGFLVSVREADSDTWTAVGDLGERLRFELEDPARYLDDTGQLLLRVERDPERVVAGERYSVFLGASIDGELP